MAKSVEMDYEECYMELVALAISIMLQMVNEKEPYKRDLAKIAGMEMVLEMMGDQMQGFQEIEVQGPLQ